MSTPFSYHISQHLRVPSNITITNSQYPTNGIAYSSEITAGGVTAISTILTSDFINTNFYNLALSSIDNTYRIVTLEGYKVLSTSPSTGFVQYNGLVESPGTFYGGSPLQFTGIDNTSGTGNYVLPASVALALTFRIVTNNTTTPVIRDIPFGGIPAFLSLGGGADSFWPYATGSTQTLTNLTNAMNTQSYMKGNSYATGHTSTITSATPPLVTSGNGFNQSGSYNFLLQINDGATQYVIPTTQMAPGSSATAIASMIQNSINTVITGTGWANNSILVGTASGNTVLTFGVGVAWNTNPGGVYQFKLTRGTGNGAGGLGPLDWAGVLANLGVSSVQGYDFTQMISFSVSTNKLIISGNNAAFNMAFLDNNTAVTATPFLSAFNLLSTTPNPLGLTPNTTYYHTQYPLSASNWGNPLSYGGDLHVKTLYAQSVNTSGASYNNLTLTGTTNTSDIIVAAGKIKVGTPTGATPSLVNGDIAATNVYVSNNLLMPTDATGIMSLGSVSANHVIAGNITLGSSVTNTVTVNSTITFQNSVNFNATTGQINLGANLSLTAGTATILASIITATSGSGTITAKIVNSITGSYSGTVSAANVSVSALVSAATVSAGSLSITGTSAATGTFDAGGTIPGASAIGSNILNYTGSFRASNALASGNLGIVPGGTSTQADGYFDKSGTNPTHTTRMNYDGQLVAYQLGFTYAPGVGGAAANVVLASGVYTLQLATSDIRLKRDIQPLNYGLAELMKSTPVSFYWKEGDSKRNIGYIANDLQKIIPEAVFGDEEKEMLSINHDYVVPVIHKSVIELYEMILEQQKELKELKALLTNKQ